MHISELLDRPLRVVEAWSTGFKELDRLTGGFTLGRLWVITGAPGAGKSTLLTQFVHRLATELGFEVQFHGARSDPADAIQDRFMAVGRVRPRTRPQDDVSERASRPVSGERLAALRGASLNVNVGGTWSASDAGGAERRCLAIDEPEFNRPPVLAREGLDDLRRYADQPGIVLVTVPRSHCFEPGPYGDRLREEWASVSDVMIEIVPVDDLGNVEFHVLRNRQGPTGTFSAIQQSHFTRFVQSGRPGGIHARPR